MTTIQKTIITVLIAYAIMLFSVVSSTGAMPAYYLWLASLASALFCIAFYYL